MKIFVDTEFTNLETPELISIGLAAEDGSSLYVEIAADPSGTQGWRPAECTDFVRRTVMPMLEGAGRTRFEAAQATLDWLESFVAPLELCADSTIDFILLDELWTAFGQTPQNIANRTVVDSSAGGRSLRQYARQAGLRQHHALDDALALYRHTQQGVRLAA